MDINKQLWVGEKFPTQELFQPVINGHMYNKAHGGLWTSSYLGEEVGSDWIQWTIDNDFKVHDSYNDKCYMLHLKDNLKIMTIHTLDDLTFLYDTYGIPFVEGTDFRRINFEAIKDDYDAIHLTEHGQMVTRHGFDMFNPNHSSRNVMENLYGWDTESMFHMRWNFKKIDKLNINPKKENFA